MNNQIEIIEVADHNINTIAQFTGTRASAISKFIQANQLDAVKLATDLSRDATEERRDFATAISGNANNEYLINLRARYALSERIDSQIGERISNSKNKSIKRYKITEMQLKILLDGLLKNRNDIENESTVVAVQ